MEDKYLEYGNEGIDCKNVHWKRIPLGTAKDRSNNKIGMLQPLFRVEINSPENERFWLCQCDCGNIIVRNAHSLNKAKCPTCGCSRPTIMNQALHNLTGQKINHLTVLNLDEERTKKERTTYWIV